MGSCLRKWLILTLLLVHLPLVTSISCNSASCAGNYPDTLFSNPGPILCETTGSCNNLYISCTNSSNQVYCIATEACNNAYFLFTGASCDGFTALASNSTINV